MVKIILVNSSGCEVDSMVVDENEPIVYAIARTRWVVVKGDSILIRDGDEE